jgi:hypothetical protein
MAWVGEGELAYSSWHMHKLHDSLRHIVFDVRHIVFDVRHIVFARMEPYSVRQAVVATRARAG